MARVGGGYKQPPSYPSDLDLREPVAVRYTDGDGEEKVETVQQRMPADISNRMVLTLVKNIAPGTQETVVSMLAITPEPRLVKLRITALGEEPFSAGGILHQAIHYVVKVDIGGFTGLLAKLLGKQPPDSHVWIVRGDRPGFVKAERPGCAIVADRTGESCLVPDRRGGRVTSPLVNQNFVVMPGLTKASSTSAAGLPKHSGFLLVGACLGLSL